MEMIVVAVVALIVFGPQRLPEIARTIGRTLNEFKRQAADIRSEFESGLDDVDLEKEPVEDEPEPVKDKPSDPDEVED
jgi:sec-independent protein translocase protein TatA